MILPGILAAAALLAVAAVFAFPAFSPIPYFPSNTKDLAKILAALDLKDGDTLIDLGAGGGLVVFAAARLAWRNKTKAAFVADEVNPVLFLVMAIKRLFHPNRQNIRLVLKDMFKLHTVPLPAGRPVFYLYVSPWYLERIHRYIMEHFPRHRIVTYFYPLPSLKPKKILRGRHKIFIY